jgi:lysophospholipase L1-like esterase
MKLPEGAEYVALGSSYAAGPGLGDRVPGSPGRAGRSAHNYPHVLAARLRLRLTDATFSGATVAQIQGRDQGATRAPQLEAVTADTRLVTLTGGGNDLGYLGFLITASLPSLLRAVTGGNRRLAELTNDREFEAKVSALGGNLIALVEGIRARAPKATIAITDYLALLPPENGPSAPPLRREDTERGRRYWNHLNLVLRQGAARAGAVFAEVSAVSAFHHAWSTEPWTERFVPLGGAAAAYHPTRAGMTAVADALEGALASV